MSQPLPADRGRNDRLGKHGHRLQLVRERMHRFCARMNQALAPAGRERQPDFELLMVTYHSRRHVLSFLAGLPPDTPLAVVDNAQGTDRVDEDLSHRAATRYQHGPARGFATAANIAVRTSKADYLVFVNPDSRPNMATINALLADLRADPRLGAVAALMLDADGRTEHGVGGWEVSFRRVLVHALGLHKVLRRSGVFARPRPGTIVDVDWTTGACVAIPRRTFEEVGGFDERYFVYCEDVDFGHRLRAAGYQVRLRTDLLVPHSAGSSGGGSLRMQRLKGASFSAYARRRLGSMQGSLIAVMMATGYVARAAVCGVMGRRALARSHIVYVQGLLLGTGTLPGAEKTE